MSRCLVIGETLIDEIHHASGEIDHHPGGSAANVAVGLARLGRNVELATWFGTDPHGAVVRTHLNVNNVSVVPGSDQADHTSTAVATLDDRGQAHYDFDIDWRLPEVHLDSDVKVVHTGSIATVLFPGGQAVLEVTQVASEFSTICYDPNLRPTIMGTRNDVATQVQEFISTADVVKVSAADLEWLYPSTPVLDVVHSWAEQGPAITVVTQGEQGSFACSAAGVNVSVEAPTVDVVDTIGAGDSFTAGLLAALWDCNLLGASQRTNLAAIDAATLKDVVQWASSCAAITVSRQGANPPTHEETLAFMNNGDPHA